ncbi:TetR/AcrR family transcriptional regulator [Sinomonas flava]|uniref:TetR/AcrR family transcriptional regulator n=1 Tax=Sinomonas flava TaxID=496857 RepID=UPI0039A69B29
MQVLLAALSVSPAAPLRGRRGTRARIIAAAQDLFATRGIRGVGIDELITRSGVAKATFYRHFRSKDVLILACLQGWGRARAAIAEAARASGKSGREALLALFDTLDGMFRQGKAPGALEQVIIEMGPEHPFAQEAARQLDTTLQQIEEIAAEAGIDDPEGVACTLQALICGAVVAAVEGDAQAAAHAKRMASALPSLMDERDAGPDP